MDEPKLIINSKTEFPLTGSDLVTFGRASDNTVPFPDDSNVSRYHAEIELRGDGYWIIDLGSFNGTKLNGESVSGEKPLNDGDTILLGGSSRIEVVFSGHRKEEEEPEASAPEPGPAPQPDSPEEPAQSAEPSDEQPAKQNSSLMPVMLIVAALAVGLAIIFVVAAGLFYFTRGTSECSAQALILKPEKGDVLKEATDVEVEISNGECVSKVSYTIEDKEFASSTEPPFSVKIEPGEFPEFSDGLNRNLKVVLYDTKGNVINQSPEVAFFIETIEVEPTTPTDPAGDPTGTDVPSASPTPSQSQVSAPDSQTMITGVAKQFSGKIDYNLSNPEFLRAVQQKTVEYTSDGFYERARKYKDAINVSFIREQNLNPALAYFLGMSRSKFEPKNNDQGTGLWRIPPGLVSANSYDGLCGNETIASASQNCAAKATSVYLKALIINIFDGDAIYGIAAFGMSPQEAEAWNSSLPAKRGDFWNVIKSPVQREEVVNFFAAALVAEYPDKFGLKNDKAISNHYSAYVK